VILLVANASGFGLLWVAKYILFNRVLFAIRPDPALITAPDPAFVAQRQRPA
jgi:hypothetical protein